MAAAHLCGRWPLARRSLVGPGGLVSMEDGVIGHFVQKGIKGDLDRAAIMEMGGRGVGSMPTKNRNSRWVTHGAQAGWSHTIRKGPRAACNVSVS